MYVCSLFVSSITIDFFNGGTSIVRFQCSQRDRIWCYVLFYPQTLCGFAKRFFRMLSVSLRRPGAPEYRAECQAVQVPGKPESPGSGLNESNFTVEECRYPRTHLRNEEYEQEDLPYKGAAAAPVGCSSSNVTITRPGGRRPT